MEILVISEEDGRLPIVDLARTLGDMVKQEKLFPEDISIDLVQENLTGKSHECRALIFRKFNDRTRSSDSIHSTSRSSGVSAVANSTYRDIVYPSTIIRANSSHLPGNMNFGYSVFMRGLQMYDRAEMRLGR
jgi:hypothetical protein